MPTGVRYGQLCTESVHQSLVRSTRNQLLTRRHTTRRSFWLAGSFATCPTQVLRHPTNPVQQRYIMWCKSKPFVSVRSVNLRHWNESGSDLHRWRLVVRVDANGTWRLWWLCIMGASHDTYPANSLVILEQCCCIAYRTIYTRGRMGAWWPRGKCICWLSICVCARDVMATTPRFACRHPTCSTGPRWVIVLCGKIRAHQEQLTSCCPCIHREHITLAKGRPGLMDKLYLLP